MTFSLTTYDQIAGKRQSRHNQAKTQYQNLDRGPEVLLIWMDCIISGDTNVNKAPTLMTCSISTQTRRLGMWSWYHNKFKTPRATPKKSLRVLEQTTALSYTKVRCIYLEVMMVVPVSMTFTNVNFDKVNTHGSKFKRKVLFR